MGMNEIVVGTYWKFTSDTECIDWDEAVCEDDLLVTEVGLVKVWLLKPKRWSCVDIGCGRLRQRRPESKTWTVKTISHFSSQGQLLSERKHSHSPTPGPVNTGQLQSTLWTTVHIKNIPIIISSQVGLLCVTCFLSSVETKRTQTGWRWWIKFLTLL